MPKIVIGGIKMENHPFWEYYYGTSTSQPKTISGQFTDYQNISQTSKTSKSVNYRPDEENIEISDKPYTIKNLNKICKLTIDRPSLRYYYNNLEVEKNNGFAWAKENNYEYVYGTVDVSGTDDQFDGYDQYEKGIRVVSKRKLAKLIFGDEKVYDFLLDCYQIC